MWQFFFPFGPFLRQAAATTFTSIPTVGKVSSITLARMSYLMLESVEEEGFEIEFHQDRVDNTLLFFTVTNLAANAWTANQLMRVQPQWAKAALDLTREAIVLEEAGKSAQAQIKRQEARKAASKAGSSIGRGIGKVFLIDSIIWAATGGVDLALNWLGIPEEDQGIFADTFGGFSPLGYVFEQVFGLILDLFGIKPEDLWTELFELIAESPTLEAAMLLAVDFYVKRIGGEINIGSYELSRAMNEAVYAEWINTVKEDPLEVIMRFAESVIAILLVAVTISSAIKVVKMSIGGR